MASKSLLADAFWELGGGGLPALSDSLGRKSFLALKLLAENGGPGVDYRAFHRAMFSQNGPGVVHLLEVHKAEVDRLMAEWRRC